MDPPPEGEAIEVRVEWIRQRSKTESLEASPLQKLTWIVTSLVGKEPKLLLRPNGTAYSWACLSAHLGFWNQSAEEGSHTVPLWSCCW